MSYFLLTIMTGCHIIKVSTNCYQLFQTEAMIMRKKLFWYILNIVIPLLIGSTIYILIRPDTYICQYFYKALCISTPPEVGIFLPTGLQTFLRCFAADILWAYALTFAVSFILKDERSYLYICIVFELIMEFIQLSPALPGTFDWLDIIFEICTTAIVSLIINKRRKRNEEVY